MTTCEFSQRVSAYADGQLSDDELALFERHLPGCSDCQAELNRMSRLGELLTRTLRDGPDIDVSARVEHVLTWRRLRRRGLAAAAVTMLAASVLVVLWTAGLLDRAHPSTHRCMSDGAAWLVRTQEPDGHWSSRAHGSIFDFDIGVTGLSVLALAEAHGEVGGSDSLEAAAHGANWLAGQQDRLGRVLKAGEQSRMYGQAVATLAMLRVYELQPTESLHSAIERALTFGVRAQSARGGWSYAPGISADTSHTGWFVLALTRARKAGFSIPEPTLADARQYVNAMTDSQGRVSYNVVGRTSSGLTGTPVAVNACLDGSIGSESQAYPSAQRLLSSNPDWSDGQHNLYLWFFASSGLKEDSSIRQVRTWQNRLVETLVTHQDRSSGTDFGSWANNDTVHANVGRVYSTSLAILCLVQAE